MPLLQHQKRESDLAVVILHTSHLHIVSPTPHLSLGHVGSEDVSRSSPGCQLSLVLCAGSSGDRNAGWVASQRYPIFWILGSEGHSKPCELETLRVLHPSPAHILPVCLQDDSLEPTLLRDQLGGLFGGAAAGVSLSLTQPCSFRMCCPTCLGSSLGWSELL